MFKLIKRIIYIFIVLNILGIVAGRYMNPPITITQIGGLLKYGKLKRDYIAYDEMGSNVKKAVLASEDQKFFTHNGFDYQAIEKAIKHNEQGKKLRGGSTISQQTAKNIFLWQGRSWLRKGLEAFYTFIIEKFWSKDIILERYLNSIEMGQGVFGVEAAAVSVISSFSTNKTDLLVLKKDMASRVIILLIHPSKLPSKRKVFRCVNTL